MNSISTFFWSYFAISGVAVAAFVALVVVWTWQSLTPARAERTRSAERPSLVRPHHHRFALHH